MRVASTPSRPRPLQRGLALVMVLWLLVLMTVIASSHSKNIRTETRLAFNQVETAKARRLAEAGLNHAILEMLVADTGKRWNVDGEIYPVSFEHGETRVAVRDVHGLVDINRASDALLEAIFAAAGVDERDERRALVDAVLDWRDPDSLKHLKGAEDDDYLRAGLQWRARDGAFSSVEEFRYILGMTNELYARLAPYLTVHSGQAGIARDYAPPWLARVLNDNRSLASPAAGTAGGKGTYRITVHAKTPRASSATLEAIVEIATGGREPMRVLTWRTPAWSTDVMPDQAPE